MREPKEVKAARHEKIEQAVAIIESIKPKLAKRSTTDLSPSWLALRARLVRELRTL